MKLQGQDGCGLYASNVVLSTRFHVGLWVMRTHLCLKPTAGEIYIYAGAFCTVGSNPPRDRTFAIDGNGTPEGDGILRTGDKYPHPAEAEAKKAEPSVNKTISGERGLLPRLLCWATYSSALTGFTSLLRMPKMSRSLSFRWYRHLEHDLTVHPP